MGRKSKEQIQREKIEEAILKAKSNILYHVCTSKIIDNGLEARVISTGYISIEIREFRENGII